MYQYGSLRLQIKSFNRYNSNISKAKPHNIYEKLFGYPKRFQKIDILIIDLRNFESFHVLQSSF